MHTYRITTYRGLPGYRLSLDGGWGNLPYETEAQAEAAARLTARGDPLTIIREATDRTFKPIERTSSLWLAVQPKHERKMA